MDTASQPTNLVCINLVLVLFLGAVALAMLVFVYAVTFLDSTLEDGISLSGATDTGYLSYIGTVVFLVWGLVTAWFVVAWTRVANFARQVDIHICRMFALLIFASYTALGIMPMGINESGHAMATFGVTVAHFILFIYQLILFWTRLLELLRVQHVCLLCSCTWGVGFMFAMWMRHLWRGYFRLDLLLVESLSLVFGGITPMVLVLTTQSHLERLRAAQTTITL